MDIESFVLTVVDVVEETGDATSITFERPAEAAEKFDFKPGQFLTLAVPSERTGLAARCYSLSSSPDEDRLTVTVKRTSEGYASNWVNDNLGVGDTIRVLPPSGIFTPDGFDDDLLLFAGGSGITPIMSITRTALARGSAQIVLFYANRDENSVIFADELTRLAAENPERLTVIHWLESVQGLPTQEQLTAFARGYTGHNAFVCGPKPFMKLATTALKELEFPRERRHQEKFVSLGGNPFGDVAEVQRANDEIDAAEHDEDDPGEPGPSGPVKVEVDLDGVDYTFADWDPRIKLLEFLESKGVDAPFSCREGECSACAIRVLEGEVRMLHNDVLDEEDLEDGIRLGCQALPVTDTLKISYS